MNSESKSINKELYVFHKDVILPQHYPEDKKCYQILMLIHNSFSGLTW